VGNVFSIGNAIPSDWLLTFPFISQVSVEINEWQTDQGKFSALLSMKRFNYQAVSFKIFRNWNPMCSSPSEDQLQNEKTMNTKINRVGNCTCTRMRHPVHYDWADYYGHQGRRETVRLCFHSWEKLCGTCVSVPGTCRSPTDTYMYISMHIWWGSGGGGEGCESP